MLKLADLPNVPILGKPVTVSSWHVTVLMVCNCERPSALMLVGVGTIQVCPNCEQAWTVRGVMHHPETGAQNVAIGRAILEPPHGSLS